MRVLSHEHFPIITLRAAATKIAAGGLNSRGRVRIPADSRQICIQKGYYVFFFFYPVTKKYESRGAKRRW